MRKRKIIHFIFNLGRGGAETMMVRVIRELNEYENIVVTLFPMDHFGKELKCDKFICLNLRSLLFLPIAIFKFQNLIKNEKPDIVHTHLFWPTIIARLSVPQKIPLITTIHAFISSSVEYKHSYVRFLDKLTYRFRESIIIAVARGALKEYFSFLNIKPYQAYVLYTFADTGRFNINNAKPKLPSPVFRVISVGALRTQKNYSFLIEAFAKIKNSAIELHIYGTGDLQKKLQQQIDKTGAKIILCGEANNLEEIIPQYDLFVMSSSYEGFSLSVLEAMAMGLPLLLSDIPSFKEQFEGIAIYFTLNDRDDFVKKLSKLSIKSNEELKAIGEKARKKVTENFTLQQHIQGLREIYSTALLGIISKA